ncbi:nodal modulator 1-like [Tropilaelaps mercedesae]|uniref:Nodal modulator 1-like n=1 Tax=Tropilaelaps mercedesae TaxID=418985 RepID=A0A1V9XZI8_9ACAR|nr:nodal modulator 1-like [Tropilaelaps mercedesae]
MVYTATMPVCTWLVMLGLLAAVVDSTADPDDITTCGGYIRSSVPIPYQNIKIKLLTRSNNLKAEAEGAPNNGYFLLPAYDRGNFQLRVEGPSGWTFEPPAVDLLLDGTKSDPCSKGKDINFTFKGFSVIGKVVSAGSSDGPEGVPVTLVENGFRRTLLTQKGGSYVFPAVMPGLYKLEFRAQITDVNVTNDNFVVDKSTTFIIEGYTVQGSLTWTDSRPTSAWAVLAVNGAPDDASAAAICCGRSPAPSRQLPKVAGFSMSPGLRVACVAQIDLDNGGKFEFPCVKSARISSDYAIFPVAMTKSGKAMEATPYHSTVELIHDDLQLEPFKITGFPVDGQVDDVGEGTEIQVVETGFETVTDAKGRFRLPGLRSGQYTLLLKKRGFQFDPKKVTVSVDHTTLPAIRPDRFEVCGEALVAGMVEIHITKEGSTLPGDITKIFSDVSSGRFCVLLTRGSYVLRPVGHVRLSPAEVLLKVPEATGKRFLFSQFQAVVSGRITCVGGICAGVRVELRAGAGAPSQKHTADSSGAFRFERVDPGTYEVCVSHPSLCFEKECQGITIVDKNLDDVRFSQKGFVLRLDSTHNAELEIAAKVLQVKAGLSTHCVVEQKPTPLTLLGCHRFAHSNNLMFRPRNEETIKLVAESHRLKVNVYTKIIVDDLRLTVKSGEETRIVELKKHIAATSDSNSSPPYLYATELYQPANKEVVLELNSASLVFRPSQTVLQMPNDCHSIDLHGKTGIFIQGSIKPAIAGVEIVVTVDGAMPSDAVRVLTDANGNYRAGPLESARYTIEANKEGYVFERMGATNNLNGIKFSRVDIIVLQKDTKAPLAGALVSVTGGPNYRNNSRTGLQGELSLIKLAPGSYYIRVMMKEYKFEPVSELIEVTENSEKRVEIFGKKVAYSVMGRVSSITGEAESDVELEAMSEACDRHEEDATSDENGHFRIRGLRENCVYQLQLKRGDPDTPTSSRRFERTLPAVREVHVGREDQTIDVLVVRPQRGTQLSVTVDVPPALLPSLRVAIMTGGRQLYNLQAASFVVVPGELPRDGQEYSIELQHVSGETVAGNESRSDGSGSSIGASTATPNTSVTIRADRAYRHVELRCSASLANIAGEAGGSGPDATAPPTPFVAVFSVFVALAIIFRNDIADFVHRRQQDAPNAGGDRRGKNKTR